MSNELSVALRLYLEANGLNSGLGGARRNWSQTTQGMQRDTLRLGGAVAGLRNQLATLGIGIGAIGKLRASAQLDRDLVRIKQTAGGTGAQMRQLRRDIFDMATQTGRPLDTLKGGFNNLVQAGLEWDQARASIKAINPASAVTGASEDVLAGGLTVAARSYNMDLAQPGKATELLDQMTVAGRLGNAELEDLSGIFARVGVNAKSANLQFADTLGYIESLSQIERSPERLATLADSTLRLFTNNNYKTRAAKATGVSFYDKSGGSRDPIDVLDDIAKKYRTLKTDRDRDRFIAKAFGQTDLDTQRGLRTLLAGDTLSTWRGYNRAIRGAGGTIARDLPEATDNAADQANRARTTLSKVGDDIAQPINKAFADLVQFQMKPREQGGLGLGTYGTAAATIGEIAAIGAGGALGKKLLGKLPGIGGGANLASGLAQGHLIGETGLATPVFVVNWPGTSPDRPELPALAGPGGRTPPALPRANQLALPNPANTPIGRMFSKGMGIFSLLGVAEQATEYVTRKWQLAGDLNDLRTRNYDDLTPDQQHMVDELGPDAIRQSRARGRTGITDAPDAVNSDDGVPQYLRRPEPSAAQQPMNGTIRIVIDQQGRARVAGIDNSPNLELTVQSGALLPVVGG